MECCHKLLGFQNKKKRKRLGNNLWPSSILPFLVNQSLPSEQLQQFVKCSVCTLGWMDCSIHETNESSHAV